MPKTDFDVLVVGAGPAGLVSALALEKLGLSVGLIAPAAPATPGRTVAILESSLAYLRTLGLGETINSIGEPLRVMRLIDDTGALIRAPEVSFRSIEIGLDQFGLNVPNDRLTDALETVLAASSVVRMETTAGHIETDDGSAIVTVDGDAGETRISARLIVGADGRSSLARHHAGIDVVKWSLPQKAIVLQFSHTHPHSGISTEFHRRSGPLTQVPLAGNTSSLVWVAKPDEADELLTLERKELAARIEDGTHHIFGTVELLTARHAYPLVTQVAKSFAKDRSALVGDAAHSFAPIGAQGLNLGFRDIAALAKCVGTAHKRQSDIGSAEVLSKFNRERHFDVWSRTLGVEALNRSLISRLPAFPLARSAALTAADRIKPLRNMLMREGLSAADSFSARL